MRSTIHYASIFWNHARNQVKNTKRRPVKLCRS